MTSQESFIWSEYARLYDNEQKETRSSIVETTHFYTLSSKRLKYQKCLSERLYLNFYILDFSTCQTSMIACWSSESLEIMETFQCVFTQI